MLVRGVAAAQVDVDAAAAALRSGHLGGAAFDVFPVEPPPIKGAEFKSVLQGCPNTILTPHIGGSTEEAQAAIGKEVALKMISFINTGSTIGSVNLPNLNLPHDKRNHRILNIHKNVPGVLRVSPVPHRAPSIAQVACKLTSVALCLPMQDVNNVLSEYNVLAQMLLTNADVGYLMIEIDREVCVLALPLVAPCACSFGRLQHSLVRVQASGIVKEKMGALSNSIKTRVLF